MRRQSGASRLNTECPAVVNARHLHAFRRLYKNDVYFLHNLYQPIACLTRQDLDERKLPAREKKMFDEAKLLEINHLISSKAIEIVLHQDQCDEIRERRPRPMPSRSRRAKKNGTMELERYAPTPSSTTVFAADRFKPLPLVHHGCGKGSEGSLFATMPSTGGPHCSLWIGERPGSVEKVRSFWTLHMVRVSLTLASAT